jgi:Arc/MetJ family transcription regulator
MKRTNLMLDEDVMEEAVQVMGVKTYSAAVNQALTEAIQRRKIRGLKSYFGQGLWTGNLSEMREDGVPAGPDEPGDTRAKAATVR